MSCRHNLANGTCSVCYPATGITWVPDDQGDSLDGPGAVLASLEEVIAKLSARIEELGALLKRSAEVVEELGTRVNDEHNALALVDKLHADIEQLTRERDDARAERDESPTHGEIDRLNARIRELEEPPVVPEGWEVSQCDGEWGLLDQYGYAVEATDAGIYNTSIDEPVPWAALRALAWATEHDRRPPHAGDKP